MRTDAIAYSPTDAAKVLGVSRSLFDRDVLPQLQCAYVGRRRVISRRELEAWLERNAVRAER